MPPQAQKVHELDIVNDDIFTLMGIPNASDDQKQSLMTLMMQTVQNRVLARILDLFDTKERKKIDAAFAKKDLATVNAMLAQKGMPEFLALVAQEVMVYKAEAASLAHSAA